MWFAYGSTRRNGVLVTRRETTVAHCTNLNNTRFRNTYVPLPPLVLGPEGMLGCSIDRRSRPNHEHARAPYSGTSGEYHYLAPWLAAHI